MYCPDCQRQLVSFNKDGTFIIAPLAGVRSVAQEDPDGGITEAIVGEAFCYRRKCRAKRWLRQHNPRRK